VSMQKNYTVKHSTSMLYDNVIHNLYCCTVHLDIIVDVYQLMHIFISLREY